MLPGAPAVETVFFGGGTPTLLPSADLVRMLGAVRTAFGLAAGAEVTTEANPDSVTPESLAELRGGRVHPGLVRDAVSRAARCWRCSTGPTTPSGCRRRSAWARAAGFEQISLDLIYGTPGESLEDWRRSLDAALACEPDHVSAYSLIVEEGTALARQVRSGALPMPDEDDLADKYLLADEVLGRCRPRLVRGLQLGARRRDLGREARCRHNELYWTSQNWLRHRPRCARTRRGSALVERQAPRGVRRPAGRRPLSGCRLARCSTTPDRDRSSASCWRSGCVTACRSLRSTSQRRADRPVADGLATVEGDRLVLTLRGRLLADAVVRELVG